MFKQNININKLNALTVKLLLAAGVPKKDALVMSWIFSFMTLRGVGHHDICELPNVLKSLAVKRYNPRPDIRTIKEKKSIAVMDGDNAVGHLAAYRMTEKAIKLAKKYGIGMVTMKNSNHFLGAAPYAKLAADNNMIGIVFSNTIVGMGAPGAKENVIGNNPWGFAARTGAGFPLLLDMSSSYASYGKLKEIRDKGLKIPKGWGLDKNGNDTTSVEKILNGGIPMPIGEHKGFGIAILVELLTSVLGGGTIIDDKRLKETTINDTSNAAIVINPAFFLSEKEYKKRTEVMVKCLKKHKGVVLPGERSFKASQKLRKSGIKLNKNLLKDLSMWAEKLNVR